MVEIKSHRQLLFIFCFNQGLHWFPMGILSHIMILTLLDSGFNIGQIGIAMAAMGTTVFLFELPTGGFADVWFIDEHKIQSAKSPFFENLFHEVRANFSLEN